VGVIENMKEVAELVRKVGDIDLNRKIVNLEGEVLDLTRDKRQVEVKFEQLEELLSLKKALVFKEPFYWLEGDETPYCPACWEGTDRAVHVTFVFARTDETRWDCPHCKYTYMDRKNRAPVSQNVLVARRHSQWG
jgi:hypothetical protein